MIAVKNVDLEGYEWVEIEWEKYHWKQKGNKGMVWDINVELRLPRTPQEEQKEKDGKPRVMVISEGGESGKGRVDCSQLSWDDEGESLMTLKKLFCLFNRKKRFEISNGTPGHLTPC